MVNRVSLSLLFIVFLTFVITPTFGQAWSKKAFTEWSTSEVIRILTDSPWAQTQIKTESINSALPANSYVATIRLRSALPIRQALLRQKQIEMNYHKFTAADKARFDKETEEFIRCPECADYYIVTVGSPMFGDSASGRSAMLGFDVLATLRDLSSDEIKASVYLENDKGERRNLVRFIPPKGEHKEAMFVFPRQDTQHRTLITVDNKAFYFKIDPQLFKGQPIPLKPFKFDVHKLTQNGEIVF
jgi:hypothetical protein